MCWPLALGTAVIVSRLTGVVEGFDGDKGWYAVRVEGRKKSAALRQGNCLAAVPGTADSDCVRDF